MTKGNEISEIDEMDDCDVDDEMDDWILDDEDKEERQCSNTNCINKFPRYKGHEMGTPSGYGDDYSFCDECAPAAKLHFNIACYHSGGMVAAPSCEGSDGDNKPHTCHFSAEQRQEAKNAFRNYR